MDGVQDTVQETGVKTISKRKKCRKANWLSEEALQIAMKRREVKSKGEKERYTHLNVEFQRIVRRDRKAFLSDQCKEIEGNNRMGKTRDLLKKVRDTKGIFHVSSVQFSRSVMFDSLRPHESQHARPPCPSPTTAVHSNLIHRVGDAIQPSHPLSSPSPPAFNLSQHQGLFQ